MTARDTITDAIKEAYWQPENRSSSAVADAVIAAVRVMTVENQAALIGAAVVLRDGRAYLRVR